MKVVYYTGAYLAKGQSADTVFCRGAPALPQTATPMGKRGAKSLRAARGVSAVGGSLSG